MGCDIHFFAERKENGQWVSMQEVKTEYPGETYEYTHLDSRKFYHDRNYDLFAILADVRNGYGFAGVPTGAGFVPIAAPRGLPEDVSSMVKRESDEWNGDGHSHSWLTLRELLDYDWDQTTVKLGVVSVDSWIELYMHDDKPTSYYGGISGPNITVLDYSKAVAVLEYEGPTGLRKACTHVRHMWTDTYRSRVSHFLEETVPKLQALGEPDSVRIVFWFDN